MSSLLSGVDSIWTDEGIYSESTHLQLNSLVQTCEDNEAEFLGKQLVMISFRKSTDRV